MNSMSEVLSYITPEHYIDLYQVKRWNAECPSWAMKFMIGFNERQKGWVVDVRNKNGVGARQVLLDSKKQAIAFIGAEYNVQV